MDDRPAGKVQRQLDVAIAVRAPVLLLSCFPVLWLQRKSLVFFADGENGKQESRSFRTDSYLG